MQRNVKKWKAKLNIRILLLVLLIAAAGIGVDLFCQRDILSLPAEEKGTFQIQPNQIDADDFETTEDGWRLKEEDGNLMFSLDGRFVSRMSVTYECAGRVDVVWRVYRGEEIIEIEDSNSMLIHTTVERLDCTVDRINLKFAEAEKTNQSNDESQSAESSGLIVKEIQIINEYQMNWHRILFVWVVLGLAAFLLLGYHQISEHMAEAYLIAALALGSLMILLTPANKASWDEEVHFFHAYCVSHFGMEVETNDILEKLFVADEENWPYSLPTNLDERVQMNEALNARMENDEYYYSRGHALAGIYTPSYIPSALGIRLGLLLNLPFTMVYQLGRLFNLMFCVVILAWAIKKIPVGKAILAVIGLLPTPLFLMAMYSYDAFITSLFALGFAFFLDEYLHRDKKITWFSFAVMALSFAVGSMPKAIYVPLILVVFLLPKEKFADRRQELLMKGMVGVLFLALMASFVLPTVLSPAESNDTRGGNTSEAGQIPYILSDIPRFINMMVYSIRTTFAGFTIGASVYGSVGHLGLEMLGMPIPLLVLAVIFMDEKCLPASASRGTPVETSASDQSVSGGRLTWLARLWILLLCLGIMAMVWLAMYLAFTPVGSNHINGVQARYYIPLLLPIYLCLCPDRIRVQVERKILYLLTLAGGTVITLVVIGRTMLSLCV